MLCYDDEKLSFFLFDDLFLTVNNVTRDTGADATATHSRRGRGDTFIQKQAILQRRARQIRLCL